MVLHTLDYEYGPMGLSQRSSVIMRKYIGDTESLFSSYLCKGIISLFTQVTTRVKV